ncbi:hypothetical protein [Streptomyces sp. NPDC048584]|uniref:hypothetical protein n=1 Tax=Streptomyces sp. NPDC048584 TaxID=3365573 RepID=UPI00371D0898
MEARARELMRQVARKRAGAWEKPGRFVGEAERVARGLPGDHLPWFWDTVGHWMLEVHRRSAARAYAKARDAERLQSLPVDPARRQANLMLFARYGALPATELGAAQAWLTHQEFRTLLAVWAASPGELPADLARRIRDSARSAGLGVDEEAGLLGEVLAAAHGKAVPDRLFDAARGPLAAHPPSDDRATALLDLFPESKNDAAAWLRLLMDCGAADAAAAGRISPEGGLAEWLRRYASRYAHRTVAGGGVTRQAMPAELLGLVTRFAPLLKADGTPVRLHEDRYRWQHLDADLLDLCLAEGIPVHDPGAGVRLEFWGEASRRDLRALAADPVFGPRLEGTVHDGPRPGGGTAISRLPDTPEIAAEVRARIDKLLDALRGGGLAAADEAVDELRELLDRPTAIALDGIEEALDALDLTGPLARALRAGLPEELGWPALDRALTEFRPDETVHVTCTWPVLTVYGDTRAVAVDHAGQVDAYTLRLPDGAGPHSVHWVGGQFLVAWEGKGDDAGGAYWSGSPSDTLGPQYFYGLRPYGGSIQGGLGYQFRTPDGGGRFDGERVLRPGQEPGTHGRDYQMYDGRDFWSADVFAERRGGWERLDPVTGEPTGDRTLPAFHAPQTCPDGKAPFLDHRILAELPPGAPPSPLGQDGRLTGCRVLHTAPYFGYSPREFVLESIDGRTASYRTRTWGRRPWGVLALPSGGEDAVVAGGTAVRCHSAVDGSLLWQVRGFAGSRDRTPIRATLGDGAGPVPPPAFWHFLTPRDASSSRALRGVTDTAVRALLASGGAAELPGVAEPTIRQGVARAVRLAADVLRRRRELSHRVAVMRAGAVVELPEPVPDTVLVPALDGLSNPRSPYRRVAAQPRPALLTSVAADGRHLRGEIDDEARLLALPGPVPEWIGLVGTIDAVAWRAVVAGTPEERRKAVGALLEVWSRQPFAEAGSRWRTGYAPEEGPASLRSAGGVVASHPGSRGISFFVQRAGDAAPADAEDCQEHTVGRDDAVRIPRLLSLIERHGPVVVTDEAVDLFRWRTGVPRAVAALVLDGIVGSEGQNADRKALRAKPYRADRAVASAYYELLWKLGHVGRAAVLAAALPEDPAELWAPGGVTAVAERMAGVWSSLLGSTPYVDDGSHAAALAKEHGLSRVWADTLLTGRVEEPLDGDGVRDAVTAVIWALAERPVGDPAAEGARALIGGLVGISDGLRDALRVLADRSLRTPVPAGQYEANPLFSVPELVDEVAAVLEVGRDAAALWLQIRALGRPGDRAVRRWNGWSVERHRAVRGELAGVRASRAGAAVSGGLPVPVHERFVRAWSEGVGRG